MNYVGFVQLRRGILEHIHNGRLTTHEFAALNVLIMIADKGTGAGEINAPLLRFYLPDLSSDAAQRALAGLEKKEYIYRENPEASRRAYRFWVNKYEVTVGRYKSRRSCLDKVARSKDLRDIRYICSTNEDATESAVQGATEGATQTANSNNNRQKKKEKGEVAAAAAFFATDELDSVQAEKYGPNGTVGTKANTDEPQREIPGHPTKDESNTEQVDANIEALTLIVANRMNKTQKTDFTERERPGLEALKEGSLQAMTDALGWALQDPFWIARIVGAGALKSLLRNLPTIQRQMAAEKQGATEASRKQLKAVSVAPKQEKPFSYEGEII